MNEFMSVGYAARVDVRRMTADRHLIVIDIDVYRGHRFSFDEGAYWPYLNRLRDVKNRVFFALLTEVCVDLYK